jgi:hypothetical protein
VNGDAADDILVCLPRASNSKGEEDAGVVLAYCGRSGTELYRVEGDAGDRLGSGIVALEDINADGCADFVVAASDSWSRGEGQPPEGALVWLSGSTGAVLRRQFGPERSDQWGAYSFGVRVDAIGDVDEDGVTDLVACAEAPYLEGMVLSGASGAELLRLGRNGVVHDGAVAAAQAGDVDGDGRNDIFVITAGYVAQVISISKAEVLASHHATPVDHGMPVASVKDVDGDGLRDVAVLESRSGSSSVVVRSGLSGAKVGEVVSSKLLSVDGLWPLGGPDAGGSLELGLCGLDARNEHCLEFVEVANAGESSMLISTGMPPLFVATTSDRNADGLPEVLYATIDSSKLRISIVASADVVRRGD